MTTYGTDFNIYDIKPNNIEKSKYSTNLYKYFKKNPDSRVFETKDNTVVIGNSSISGIEGITGRYLNEIVRESFDKYFYTYPDNSYEDITKTFMSEYIRIGRCVWDTTHDNWMIGSKNRFTNTNENERVCNWCGEVQHKKEVVKVTYEWDNLHEINIYGENKIKSKYPFKVYSISKDGNNNEVEVFEGAFETLEKAKKYRPDHNDYHKLLIEVEEDNHV